jgi:hypothetical protein
MGADGLIYTFKLPAPAHGTGATQNILLIKRNDCQAERLLGAKQANHTPASRSENPRNTVKQLNAYALPGCALQRLDDAEVVTSSTSHQRAGSG